jgi:hypothetical protein
MAFFARDKQRGRGGQSWSDDGIEPVNSDQDRAGSQSRGLERIRSTGAVFWDHVVHLLALPSNKDFELRPEPGSREQTIHSQWAGDSLTGVARQRRFAAGRPPAVGNQGTAFS